MLTNAQITTAYQGVLRRNPSMAEIALHQVITPDVPSLISGLKSNSENHGEVLPVIRAFQWVLGRRPDSAGLDFWVGQVRGSTTIAALYAAFLVSSEGQALYPNSSTDTVFVTACYTNVFGRAADSAGLAFWVGQLGSGMSRADVLHNFGEAGEAHTRINSLLSAWQDQAGVGSGVYSGSFF